MRTIQICLVASGGILAGVLAPVVGIYWGNANLNALGQVVAVAISLLGLGVIALSSSLRLGKSQEV